MISALPHSHNPRRKLAVNLLVSGGVILAVLALALLLDPEGLRSSGGARKLPPSWAHPFGTDWLGRDMFTRTILGLRLSLMVGLFASAISVGLAALVGITAGLAGPRLDAVLSWIIDLFIGMPHLVFMVLVSFMVGGGITGTILAVSVTHWMSLARLLRAEALQLRNATYVEVARQLGHSRWYIARRHVIPHLFPQLMIGLLLMFPHIILHEAALSFLGFGLSPQTPAIGILLSEAMGHLSTGLWWLVFFPGILLLVVVQSFDALGESLRKILDPVTAHG